MKIFVATLSALSILLTANLSFAQPTRAITKITGDLYRFQNNAHFSVFLVTSEGVIATDPIDKEAAAWLKAEIQQRFNQPVKYLIYSHDHRDHISGGEVFDGEAVVIAHENTKAKIIGEKRPTAVPEVTYTDHMTVTLGGKTVELLYVGRNHSDNTTVMYFPAERAVFGVDFISIDRLPYQSMNDSYMPDWITSIKAVEMMDFDIFQPGHGKTGTKADVIEHREYLEDLHRAVLTAARSGKTLDEMKQMIKLEKYRHFDSYDTWLPMNIEGMYRMVSANRVGN